MRYESYMKIITYKSEDAPTNHMWLATIYTNGQRLDIRFLGPTENEAKEKAQKFWDTEIARQRSIQTPLHALAKDEGPMQTITLGKGRGRGGLNRTLFGGTVWVINRGTGHKLRVPAGELSRYAAEGYERGRK